MNREQRHIIEAAELDPSEFFETSAGWSHRGFVAWQLELCDESKRTTTEDSRIAEVLRRLDDCE